MKIAYIILCHTDPTHIFRLAEKITHGTNDEAFIHVDGKCNVAPFRKELEHNPQAHLIENRVAVNWGGFSSINATINTLRVANRGGVRPDCHFAGIGIPDSNKSGDSRIF